MKIPIVKEWGSWAVFCSSCLAGLVTGLLTRPWLTGRDYSAKTLFTIIGLTFLINSKNPLTSAIRSKGDRGHVMWVFFSCLAGLAFMIPFLMEGARSFIVFSLLVISYVILVLLNKEHHLAAEINGFSLLTIAAPAVYFAVTGQMSWRLYLAVTIFFCAGVFKVRLRLRKTLLFRSAMMFYCLSACAIFYFLDLPVILLLPLIENIWTALWIRPEKLSTTGNTELIKGVIFLILLGFFWR